MALAQGDRPRARVLLRRPLPSCAACSCSARAYGRSRHPHDGHRQARRGRHLDARCSCSPGRQQGRADPAHLLGQAVDADHPRRASSVYRKEPGTNAHGMVDSSYFIRGYAIHGYVTVPTYNASHGCLRVPVPDAAGRSTAGCTSATSSGSSRSTTVLGRLGDEALEHAPHAAALVRGAHAVGAVALGEDPVDLAQRVVLAEVGRVVPRDLERLGGDLARRPHPLLPPEHRVEPVAPGAERGLGDRLGALDHAPAVGGGHRERVDERRDAEHRARARLGVHRADLDRPEPRVGAQVPPQEGVVGDVRGRAPVLDALDVVVPAREGPRDDRARVAPEELRPRGGEAGVAPVPVRASSPRAPAAAAGARASGWRRRSPSAGPACRRGRAAHRSACARAARAATRGSRRSAAAGRGGRRRSARSGARRRPSGSRRRGASRRGTRAGR